MRERSAGMGRLWLAMVATMGLAPLAPAALTEAQLVGISYYSTFDDSTKGIAPERGEGAWNTGEGGTPAFITVTGSNCALDLARYNAWTDKQSVQSVLSAEEEAFTIAFSGRMGSTAKGILFAFGNSGTSGSGGLSFRRGDTSGSFVVCTGQNKACITYAPKNGADVTYRHYALVKDASGLRLYVDGEAVGEGAAEPQGTVIATQFQWGSRHGSNFSDEKRGNGAIATLGVWKRALTAEEIAALVQEMSPAFEAISFDVPEGWATKPVPTQAVQRALTGDLALEQDAAFRQTLGGRAANVAEITGGENQTIFGVNDSSHGNKDTELQRDVWLKVSGGNHDVIVGGSENHWNGNHATPLRGDIFVELGEQASAKNVVGAIHKSGNGEDNGAAWPGAFAGNVAITVAGTVSGSIVGGATSSHRCTPTLTGNTLVRVLAVQGTNANALNRIGNRILGGSGWNADNNNVSGVLQTGNAKVEVSLPETASGNFVKEIAGGSYASSASYAITGNTSVSISAPNAVNFTSPIYGASISNTSTATVSGNSSVTLAGGTYSNSVFAGGYGANGGVAGKATLTLKGGTFKGTLGVGANGATVGSSELVIDGGEAGIDLSNATVNKDFAALTLKSGLNLGTNRLPEAAFAIEGEQTLTLEVTAAELADRRVSLGRAETVPEGLTVVATGLPEGETWGALSVIDGTLYCAPAKTSHTWLTPDSGSAWADGLPNFKVGDGVTFGANTAQEPVTLGGDVRVGDLSVKGNYALAGTGLLSADAATVSGTLTFAETQISSRYVRWVPTAHATTGANNNSGVALAELELLLGGTKVAWKDATITASQAAENNEHKDDHLLDGNLSTKWYWSSAPATFNDCTLTIDAGEGKTFTFNGYRLAMADQAGRDPTAWRLEVSDDGTAWRVVDTRTYTSAQTNAWPRNTWAPEAYYQVRLSVADTLSVFGILGGASSISAGAISFAEGSTLVVPAEGILMLEGAVSGTATLDVSAWGGLSDATARPVLRAPDGLTLTPPEGYTVHYKDGRYWLARPLTQPLKLELGADAQWKQAAWKDASETPIAVIPEQWDAIPDAELRAEVTAVADATLTLEAARTVGAFTVKPSEQTLTLGGAKLSPSALTVEEGATLAATSTALAIPSGATLNGTLNYDVASGSAALPSLAGTGTLVKTGAGTLTLAGGTTLAPKATVREGVLRVNGSISSPLCLTVEAGGTLRVWNAATSLSSTENNITLKADSTFELSNGSQWNGEYLKGAIILDAEGGSARLLGTVYGSMKIGATVSGAGTLVFAEGGCDGWHNTYAITGNISGTLAIRHEDHNNVTLSGTNTYSGGTVVATGSSPLIAGSEDALGKGDVTIASGATLTVASDTTLNLHRTVSGLGTIVGAAQLQAGASLDASEATAEACLTVGTLSVAEGVTILVTLPADVAPGTKLLAWTEGPASEAFAIAEATPLASEAMLVAEADGLYYYEKMALGTAGSDNANAETLSEGAQRQLVAAAFKSGATSVATVTGTTAKRSLTAKEIDAALTCFNLTPVVTVAEGGAASVTVSYDFGIVAMAYDPATEGLTVTARVQGAEEATATFAKGVRVELYATDDAGTVLASAEAVTGESEVRLVVEPAKARAKMARPLKVRAVTP